MQPHQCDLLLLEDHFRPIGLGDGHVALVVSGQGAGELLPPLSGTVQLHVHLLPHALGEVLRLFQGTVRACAAHFQHIAALDGVGLVQRIAEGTADGLALVDVHALRSVDEHPQVPSASLPDVFHIPERTSGRFHQGLRQLGGQISYFHASSSKKHWTSPPPARRWGQDVKKSGALAPLSS